MGQIQPDTIMSAAAWTVPPLRAETLPLTPEESPVQEHARVAQKLLDEITTAFGPHLEDISIKQDLYRTADQRSTPLTFISYSSTFSPDSEETSASTTSRSDSIQLVVAITPVPEQDPRIHLGHSIYLPWLCELRITFRAVQDKPFFLYPSTFDGVSAQTMIMIDFSSCESLETLSIEDLDRSGNAHRLHRQQQPSLHGFNMIIPMLPFAQDQGLKLPARLKALEMIGHSADRFNFGWLSATPRLERLQILGIRTKGQIGLIESESQTSPWHWRAVVLLYLKEMVVHHSPARHFMFEIVQQCPRLEVLDVRGVRWTAFQTFNDHSPVIIETGMQSRYSEISSARGKEYLTCCRMEITPGAQELSAPKMFSGLKHVFHTYFSNVVKLRVDGVPARIVIDATGGASWASCDGDTVTRMMRRLERVVVKDSIGIVEYGMVPVPRTGSREGGMNFV